MKNILEEVMGQLEGLGDKAIQKRLMEKMAAKQKPLAVSVEATEATPEALDTSAESDGKSMTADELRRLMELYAQQH